MSGINQYGNTYHPTKFGACVKNRTIRELCRRTTSNNQRLGSLGEDDAMRLIVRVRVVLKRTVVGD